MNEKDVEPVDGGIHAVVILGCRVRRAPDGGLDGALGRRVAAGAAFARERGATRIVVAGGKPWRGVIEADAMADALARQGLSGVVRERRSWSTRQNAENTAMLLGPCRVALVTCAWHMARASGLFCAHGFDVVPVPAHGPPPGFVRGALRWGKERFAAALGE